MKLRSIKTDTKEKYSLPVSRPGEPPVGDLETGAFDGDIFIPLPMEIASVVKVDLHADRPPIFVELFHVVSFEPVDRSCLDVPKEDAPVVKALPIEKPKGAFTGR